MKSINKSVLLGNLGSDPEVRFSPGGTCVARLRVATNEVFRKDGEFQERTEWHTVVIFGKDGERAGGWYAQGDSIYVEGRKQTRKYTDREGIEREAVEVIADLHIPCGGRGTARSTGSGQMAQAAGAETAAPPGSAWDADEETDGKIPF